MKLTKAKLDKEQGLLLSFEDSLITGGKKNANDKFSPPVHKDLHNAFQELKPALIKTLKLDWIFNVLQPNLLTTPEEHEANKVLKEIIWKGYEEQCFNVEVTGFNISGEDANKGVIVTGKQRVHGKTVAINSPRIVFSHTEFGIEEELEADIKKCITEVQAYLGGKHGEDSTPNLFNQPEVEEEVELSQEELQKRRDEAIENAENGVIDTPHGKVKTGKKRSSPLKKVS